MTPSKRHQAATRDPAQARPPASGDAGPLFGEIEPRDAFEPGTVRPPRRMEGRAPFQRGSYASQAGAEFISGGGRRESVADCIVYLLLAAGPVRLDANGDPLGGMTIEELTTEVERLRNKPTKETTVGARISGRDRKAELDAYVVKAGHRRPGAAGVPRDIYIHRKHAPQEIRP